MYDLYEDALTTYKEAVSVVQANLNERSIPESEWPSSIANLAVKNGRKRDTTLSVFEEMEKRLKAKQEQNRLEATR